MNWIKFLISSVIGAVAYFFSGWLIYGILLRPYIKLPDDIAAIAEYPPEEFKMSFMILACLFFAAVFALIFMRWANISTFMGGAKAGIIIGVLISLSVGFSMASMYKFATLNTIFFNALGEIVTSGLTGGVIGWYLGRGD